jgi:hypothetical protein
MECDAFQIVLFLNRHNAGTWPDGRQPKPPKGIDLDQAMLKE